MHVPQGLLPIPGCLHERKFPNNIYKASQPRPSSLLGAFFHHYIRAQFFPVGRSHPSINLVAMMSNAEEGKTGEHLRPPTAKLDHKVLYEETRGAAPFASATSESDEDGDAFHKNPFLDPDVAEHWSNVYEKSTYECRAEFDPAFTWTEEEEMKLVRRLDWRVCLWAVRSNAQHGRLFTDLSIVHHVLRSPGGSWQFSTGGL